MLRVIKIATHELGHMFCLGHCIFYQCIIMGTNHLGQTDRNPVTVCPICYRKLWKCLKWDHVKRYKGLAACCEEFGGAFTWPQEYEKNKLSIKAWFEKRLAYLDGRIKDYDYDIPGASGGHLALPPKTHAFGSGA